MKEKTVKVFTVEADESDINFYTDKTHEFVGSINRYDWMDIFGVRLKDGDSTVVKVEVSDE